MGSPRKEKPILGLELSGCGGHEGVDEPGKRKVPVERLGWLSLPFSSVSPGSFCV